VIRVAAKKPAKKAAPKKAPKKAPAKKKAAKKAPSMKAGSQLYCETCGIVLTVDETCDCGACDIICCGEEMQIK
jgi:hypothetical protein